MTPISVNSYPEVLLYWHLLARLMTHFRSLHFPCPRNFEQKENEELWFSSFTYCVAFAFPGLEKRIREPIDSLRSGGRILLSKALRSFSLPSSKREIVSKHHSFFSLSSPLSFSLLAFLKFVFNIFHPMKRYTEGKGLLE